MFNSLNHLFRTFFTEITIKSVEAYIAIFSFIHYNKSQQTTDNLSNKLFVCQHGQCFPLVNIQYRPHKICSINSRAYKAFVLYLYSSIFTYTFIYQLEHIYLHMPLLATAKHTLMQLYVEPQLRLCIWLETHHLCSNALGAWKIRFGIIILSHTCRYLFRCQRSQLYLCVRFFSFLHLCNRSCNLLLNRFLNFTFPLE